MVYLIAAFLNMAGTVRKVKLRMPASMPLLEVFTDNAICQYVIL